MNIDEKEAVTMQLKKDLFRVLTRSTKLKVCKFMIRFFLTIIMTQIDFLSSRTVLLHHKTDVISV